MIHMQCVRVQSGVQWHVDINLLFLIVIKTYFGAVVVKRCDFSTCYDRSWSRMSLT